VIVSWRVLAHPETISMVRIIRQSKLFTFIISPQKYKNALSMESGVFLLNPYNPFGLRIFLGLPMLLEN
jgi:hypothetical protein